MEFKKLLEVPEMITWFKLLRAYRQTIQVLQTRLMTKFNWSWPRLQILFYLYFEGPLPAIRLSELMNVTRGNISTFIRRLLADGLIVVSSKSPSASRPYYELSSAGREQFEEVFPHMVTEAKAIIQPFSEPALRDLEDLANRNCTKSKKDTRGSDE